MNTSRISSLLTPLRNAPRICNLSSCGRFKMPIIARLSMLRVFRGSSSRPQTAPQQYSVTSSWNGRLKSSALRSELSTYSLPRTAWRTSKPLTNVFWSMIHPPWLICRVVLLRRHRGGAADMDRTRVGHAVDLGVGKSMLAQHLGGVLAEDRCAMFRAARRRGEFDRQADRLHRAELAVMGLDDHLAGERLLVVVHLPDVEGRTGRHAGTLEQLEPFAARPFAQLDRQHRLELLEVPHALRIGG